MQVQFVVFQVVISYDEFYKMHSVELQVNIHPVRLAMKMPDILIKEYSQVKKVLELMCEKEMKKGTESNEVLAFKFHYLAYMLNEVRKCE